MNAKYLLFGNYFVLYKIIVNYFYSYPGKICGIGEMWKIIVKKMFPQNIFKFCTSVIKIDTALKQV